MKFAPIVPIKYLGKLASLSDFHMCLAPYLSEPLYKRYYAGRVKRGDTVILDNGTAESGTVETGRAIPVDELFECWKSVGLPSIVVIPDDFSARKNLTRFREFLNKGWYKRFEDLRPDVQFMAVPHSYEDFEIMTREPVVDIIGINKGWELEPGGRAAIIEKFSDCGKKFHLLGLRKNPVAEIYSALQFKELVIGCDSTLPYRIARSGRYLEEFSPNPPPMDFYEFSLADEILDLCRTELKWFIGECEETNVNNNHEALDNKEEV